MTPRKLTVYCDGRRRGDKKRLQQRHTHNQVDVAALISYEYAGKEWWEADDRADRSIGTAPAPDTIGRPDIALALVRSVNTAGIRCPSRGCGYNVEIGDRLGLGYRSRQDWMAHYKDPDRAEVDAERDRKHRQTCDKLSLVASAGRGGIALSSFDDIVNLP